MISSAAYVCRGLPVKVQRNGLAKTSLKYRMKLNSLLRKSSTEVKLPRRISLRMMTPKTISIWFSHDVCFGKNTKRMRWLLSDKNSLRLSCDRRTPCRPFFSQVLLDRTGLRHRFHQALGGMDVQVVH